MNRRQKKLEQKRKKRDQAKKKARAALARKPPADVLILNAAARSPFGPCYVSADWDDENEPTLVTLVATRKLPDERLVVGIALIDRTCLGIKDAYFEGPWTEDDLDEYLEQIGAVHGGMNECESAVAQSVVYAAIDYARKLGFAPHRDFPEKIFGPRPAELVETPWAAEERPLYVAGPHDDVDRILAMLDGSVGVGNYDFVDPLEMEQGEEEGVIEGEVVETWANEK
jgi:hypothetical protein